MRLAFKIIIGIVIAIVVTFAILIAVVFIVGVTTMSNLEEEFIERSAEIRMVNPDEIEQQIIRNQERMVAETP